MEKSALTHAINVGGSQLVSGEGIRYAKYSVFEGGRAQEHKIAAGIECSERDASNPRLVGVNQFTTLIKKRILRK